MKLIKNVKIIVIRILYFSEECIKYLVEIGINHLLIDLPSVDREKDDGHLKNHKIFLIYLEVGMKIQLLNLFLFQIQ